MSYNSQIVKELQELSPLLSEKGRFPVPYQVPAGYLEALADNILHKVSLPGVVEELEEWGSFLQTLDKNAAYKVPPGYFNALPLAIQDGANALDEVNNTLENGPVLPSPLQIAGSYQAPSGYFEENPTRILAQIRKESKTKVIGIGFQSKWLRYAAAAVLTGFFFTTAWLWQSSPDKEQGMATATEIPSTISESELELFLEMGTEGGPAMTTFAEASTQWKSEDLHSMLADVSEDELTQYAVKSILENEF